MKYYRMSFDEVVSKRAYLNIILLNAAIPGTKPVESKDGENDVSRSPEKKIHANTFFSQFM